MLTLISSGPTLLKGNKPFKLQLSFLKQSQHTAQKH